MDLIQQYLERAAEIIGDRTPGEEKYDREVIQWLGRGEPIRKALAKANEKYPAEALIVEDALLPELQSRYQYLLEHERILRKLQR
jgi:hypothetical protein